MAIHDATYSSRPSTYRELRWRMVHLFEERVGKRISESNLEAAAREQEALDKLRRGLG
jgi:hypothetical protein